MSHDGYSNNDNGAAPAAAPSPPPYTCPCEEPIPRARLVEVAPEVWVQPRAVTFLQLNPAASDPGVWIGVHDTRLCLGRQSDLGAADLRLLFDQVARILGLS